MVPGGARVKLRVPCVAVILVGVPRLPLVLCEMRLGERNEHSFVVRRAQDLCVAQMGARLAPVVVSIDKIDAETLEPLHALLRALVGRPRRPNLGVVQRDRGEEDAAAVQVKVSPIDPKLTETEALRKSGIQNLSLGIEERKVEVVHVLRGVRVPDFFGLPSLSERATTLLQVSHFEGLAGECCDTATVIGDPGAESILCARGETLQCGVKSGLPVANGGAHLHLADTRPGRA